MRWKVRECHCQSNHAIRFLSNLFLESHIEDYALFTSPFAAIISRWSKATWIPNIYRRKEGFVVFPSVFLLFGSNITCWRTNLKCKGEKSAAAKPYCLHWTCPTCQCVITCTCLGECCKIILNHQWSVSKLLSSHESMELGWKQLHV